MDEALSGVERHAFPNARFGTHSNPRCRPRTSPVAGMLIAPVARVESSKYVLVTEDDESIRELLQQALTDANYTVSTANNGRVVMQLMHERAPDLPKPFDIDVLLFEVERLTTRPIRQCAWCGQVPTSNGEFDLHAGRILRWATHGVCPQCKHREMQQISERVHRPARPRPGCDLCPRLPVALYPLLEPRV